MLNDFDQLMERLRAGDEEAAKAVFDQHVGPLIVRVRQKLSAKLSRRLDPEDVVQSAFRSFFSCARAGRYEFNDSGDLWRLLVKLTWHKLLQKVERESAAQRSFKRDLAWPEGTKPDIADECVPPESELAALELVEQASAGLDDCKRQIFELRLQGYHIADIANEVDLSERTVRRVLSSIKKRIENILHDTEAETS